MSEPRDGNDRREEIEVDHRDDEAEDGLEGHDGSERVFSFLDHRRVRVAVVDHCFSVAHDKQVRNETVLDRLERDIADTKTLSELENELLL